MSIIIYGPPGCGKTRNAERLRRHFGMHEIVDDGSDPFPLTQNQVYEFKMGRTLFLTQIAPQSKDYSFHSFGDSGGRRVISFETAMKMMNGE